MKTIVFTIICFLLGANTQAAYLAQPPGIEEKFSSVFGEPYLEETYDWWLGYYVSAYCRPIDRAENTQEPCGIFGIFAKTQEGEDTFKITDTVPLVEGQLFGWAIPIGPKATKVKWKEVFELPARPETWGSGEAGGEHEISEDGKVSITEKEVVVEDGYIQNVWSVEVGDPVGDYVIQVFVNDLLLETFHFKVVRK